MDYVECSPGSNSASNFKSVDRLEREQFEITSMIQLPWITNKSYQ